MKKLAQALDAKMPTALKRSITEDHGDTVPEPAFYEYPVHYLVPATFD